MRTSGYRNAKRYRALLRAIIICAALALLMVLSLAYPRNSRAGYVSAPKPSQSRQRPIGRVTQTGNAAGRNRISESGRQQIAALIAEKETRTPIQQKIDSHLLQAVREARGEQMAAGVNLVKADVKADDTGRLEVDISADVNNQLMDRIKRLGGQIIYPSVEYKTIRAKINLSDVESVASLPEVKFIKPAALFVNNRIINPPAVRSLDAESILGVAHPSQSSVSQLRPAPISLAKRMDGIRRQLTTVLSDSAATIRSRTGDVVTEGDRTHRADDARKTFGFDGEAVRIGVLSDSFSSFLFTNPALVTADIAAGELPGAGNPFGDITPVTVVEELFGNDEGRAILQIVHDIAPKAKLYFASAGGGDAKFAHNIRALRNQFHCDILIDDIEYFDEPVFQDGPIAQAVNAVTASGALYFSSAGNEGSLAKNTSGVWEGDFNDAGSTLIISDIPGFGPFKIGTVHNFGTIDSPIAGDEMLGPNSVVTLNWSDPMGSSDNDYDLFLLDPTLTKVLAVSANIQNGTQDPIEGLGSFSGPSFGLPAGVLVVLKASGAQARAISLNAFRTGLAIATNGQIHGHSAAAGAFSVAATPAAVGFRGNPPTGPFPNPFVTTNQVETFSSDGPRRIFYNADGTPITPGNVLFGTNGGELRNKPDITAADGVSSSKNFKPTFFNPFFGTSAAAPHAAAIAALLKSAKPSLTAEQIRSILTSTALDIESPGYDNTSGFGIVQAFQAMAEVAPIARSTVNLAGVATAEGQFSNHNGVLEPGESATMVFQLVNSSIANATNVNAVLTTSTSGVTISSPVISMGDISAGGSFNNTNAPFTFGIGPGVPCNSKINFILTVTLDNGDSPAIFAFTTSIGSGDPGGVCSPPPNCTAVNITTGVISGGSTGSPYAQSFAATGGSGGYLFSLSGGLPAGLSFSENKISGTPLQAGSFTITLSATDVAGCGVSTLIFTLAIAGNAPASITAIPIPIQGILLGNPVPFPLTVIVRDASNVPLAGVNVTFTAPNIGSSGSFAGGTGSAIGVSDKNGMATAPAFTVNHSPGFYNVLATVSGLPPAIFGLFNSCQGLVTDLGDSGPGTLRDAIDNVCDGNSINFAPNIRGTISLQTGELLIRRNISIVGPGADVLTISGNGASRIFNISAPSVFISGLTIRDGSPPSQIFLDDSGVFHLNGGGGVVVTNGTLSLSDSVVTNNNASVVGLVSGGGLDVAENAQLLMTRCAVVNNTSPINGGGIWAETDSLINIYDSTIAGNVTMFDPRVSGDLSSETGAGGGIRVDPGGQVQLVNTTIFGNSANKRGGNISNGGGAVILNNSVIAGGILTGASASDADISGTNFISNDFNLIQDTTGGSIFGTVTHNITGLSPLLLPLSDYGGPIPGLLPQPNSPMIDAGGPISGGSTDQRNFPRVVGAAADIGAVETNYSLVSTDGDLQSTLLNTAFTTRLQTKITESGFNFGGATVTFTAPSSGPGGTFSGGGTTAVVTTNTNGVAVAPDFTANGNAGSYTVTASIGQNLPNIGFTLNNIAPILAASISATAGTPQIIGIGNDFPTNLQARVQDGAKVGIAGLTVTFTIIPNGNTSATFPNNATSVNVITNSVGVATAPVLTANEFAGSYTINATVSGIGSPATYALTNRVVFGDITGEGTVNVVDLFVMANFLAGNIHLTPGQKITADVYDDGSHVLNVLDLFTLANLLAGNVHRLPVTPFVMNSRPAMISF